MSSDHDVVLERRASELAERLASAGGRLRGLEILESSGILPLQPASPAPAARPLDDATWVGIWRSQLVDGEIRFQRAESKKDEWLLWADVPSIPPKGRRKRVVFLGESVARGYFYDPYFTPAGVLEAMLGACDVPGGVEVVDLARTNLGPNDLMELLPASLHLEPDAIVIFAGNNWQMAHLGTEAERRAAVAALRSGGVSALRRHLEIRLVEVIRAQVAGGLARLASLVPMVFVLPEFNLLDWHAVAEPDAPWLPGSRNLRWTTLCERARHSAAQTDWAAVEAAAAEMVELDEGCATAGASLLAQCRLRQGRAAQARDLLEQARDALLWDSAPQSPRPVRAVQQALREGLPQAGITCVDLPREFARQLGGELPGRRLFVDYCHLTCEGIRWAMSRLTCALAPRIGGRERSDQDLLAAVGPAEAEVEAQAHFLAAIHNAHWGQPFELVQHHCREALVKSSQIREPMIRYLEMQIQQAPVWMCSALERLRELKMDSLNRYILSRRDHEKLFDEDLIEAVSTAVAESGEAPESDLRALRAAERGLRTDRPVDLLDLYFRSCWMDRGWLWLSGWYFKAYSRISRFPLLCAERGELTLELTCRQPPGVEPEGSQATLWLGGEKLEELALSPEWQTWKISPAPELLGERGVLELHWPLQLSTGQRELEQAAENLALGLDHDLRPCFGEIHSFRARLSR